MYHLLKTIPEDGNSHIVIEIDKFDKPGIVSFHRCFETSCQIYWFSNVEELNKELEFYGIKLSGNEKHISFDYDVYTKEYYEIK